MNQPVPRLLYWAPRALGVLFAVFISIFALDVFGEGYSFWETMLALLIHLIPTGLVALSLAVAWRWEWAGAILFAGLGVFSWAGFGGASASLTRLILAGPLLLIGALFLAGWLYRRAHPPA